jgi:phosphoribosylanthranilate isomerase
MWVKICGMTTPEAVSASLEAGADAIGFVFAESPRRVMPEAAARLAEPARGRVACVAVTRHPPQSLLDEILDVFKPDILQSDRSDLEVLRWPAGLSVLPVLRAGAQVEQPLPPRLLFEGARSGAGVPCDWNAAWGMARRSQLVLAGGLDAGNVGAAIAQVLPFGVDVSSGVEDRPGIKSPAAIASFVATARAAFLKRIQA